MANADKRYGKLKEFNVVCSTCNKKFIVIEREKKFPKKNKYYCCISCAHTHTISDNTKIKISNTLKQTIKSKSPNNIKYKLYKVNNGYIEKIVKYKTCKICGKEYEVNVLNNGRYSTSVTCSKKCLKILCTENGKEIYKESVLNGTNKSWTVRPIASYAENYFKNVLNTHNIEYEFNKYIKGCGYFLDFLIIKNEKYIDLEIDGKQHLTNEHIIHDKIRDSKLKELGYTTYRIPWNCINTIKGQEIMNDKIKNFLLFYNNL